MAEDTVAGPVHSLAFSPGARYLMSVSKGAVTSGVGATIWDLHGGVHKVRSLMEEEVGGDLPDLIHCAWSPDGRWIAAGPQSDGSVHVWETTTFQRLHFHGIAWKGALLAFSADGCRVVTAARGCEGRCWIWNVESGRLHQSLRGHTAWVRAAAFNLDRTRVVTGAYDSTIRIWDAESGEELGVIEASKELPIRIDTLAFSRDGTMVLSQSSSSRLVGDWDDTTSEPSPGLWEIMPDGTVRGSSLSPRFDIGIAAPHSPHTACLSPCGRYFVLISRFNGGGDDEETEAEKVKDDNDDDDDDGDVVSFYRTDDWKRIAKVSGGKHTQVTHVAISPDGRVLCYGTDFGMVFFRRIQDIVSATNQG